MSASRALPDLSALRLFATPTGGRESDNGDSGGGDAPKRARVDPASLILEWREYTFTFAKQRLETGLSVPDCKLTFRVYRCKRPWQAVEALMPIAKIDFRGYTYEYVHFDNEDADWICIVLHERAQRYGPLSTWAIAVELNGNRTCDEFLPAFSAKWRRGEICAGHKHIVAKYLVATDIILRSVLRLEPLTPGGVPLDDMLKDIREKFDKSGNITKRVFLADDTAISDPMESRFLLEAYAALIEERVREKQRLNVDDIRSYVATAAANVGVKLLWRAPYYQRLGACEDGNDPEFTMEGAVRCFANEMIDHEIVKEWIEKLHAQAEERPHEWPEIQSDADALPRLPTPCQGWEVPLNPHFSLVLVNGCSDGKCDGTVTERLVAKELVTSPTSASVRTS